MKLILHSVGVLMVTGAIYLVSAPFLSLMQPAATSSLAQPAATSSLPDLPGVAIAPEQAERLNQLEAQTRSHLQAGSVSNLLLQLRRDVTCNVPTWDKPQVWNITLIQLEAALECESGISQSALTALNLSPAQQTELMQVLLSTQQQTVDVLTPNQIEKIRHNLPFHP